MLRTEDLSMLEEISVEGNDMFRICGTFHLPSLVSLELDLSLDRDVADWLVRCPNLEKLTICGQSIGPDMWEHLESQSR